MLRTALLLSMLLLSGCAALAFEEVALMDAGVGLRASAAARLAATEEMVSTARIMLSDDLAASVRTVRFSPNVRGRLSEGLSQLTNNGSRSAELGVTRNGLITGADSVLGRLSRNNGLITSRNGVKLGFVGERGTVFEFLSAGEVRPIGVLRGFLNTRPATFFADATLRKPIGTIPANGLIRVTRFGENGYWISLESGVSGWLRASDVAYLAILGTGQQSTKCHPRAGAVLTASGSLLRYDALTERDGFYELSYRHTVLLLNRHEVATCLNGDVVVGDTARRKRMIASLNSSGLLYPPLSAYTETPMGDEPNRPAHAPDLPEVPL